MDQQLLYILQQKAPFLLSYIAGVDYLSGDSVITPLMVLYVKVGQKIFVVPIVGGDIYAIYDPEEDRYYPLSPEWFEFLLQKASSAFQATNPPANVEDSPNLYNMIRPPMSGRTVYASVVDEPVSKEYFEYGFVILPEREPTCRAYEVQFNGLETIRPGKTYLIRDFEGNLVPARLFIYQRYDVKPLLDEAQGDWKDLEDSKRYFYVLITPKKIFAEINPEIDRLPVGVPAPDQSIPYTPEEPGTRVFVCDDTYCYLVDTELGKEGVEIVVSPHVKTPLFGSGRVVLPAGKDYQTILAPSDMVTYSPPAQMFVTTIEGFKGLGVTKIVKLFGGSFGLTDKPGEALDKVAVAKELVARGVAAEDVYRLIKTAEDQGEVAFVIAEANNQFKNSLNDTTTPQMRLQELLEAFDSQMRHFLSLYTKGYLAQETQRVIEDLYDALAAQAGGG